MQLFNKMIQGAALAAITLTAPAAAANCAAVNTQFYEEAAVQMMWSIRAWICPNAWWESITAYPQGDWCDNAGGFNYDGYWQIAGMSSEQDCWDILEQIIDQCMYGPYEGPNSNTDVDNGGWWSYGNTWAQGYFWVDNQGSCQNRWSGKRDTATPAAHHIPDIILADGTVVPAPNGTSIITHSGKEIPLDRQVWINTETGKLVKEVKSS